MPFYKSVKKIFSKILKRVLRTLTATYKANKLFSVKQLFAQKSGIEIGGPSQIFTPPDGLIPIYSYANKIDGVNFSNSTIWEGSLIEGENYKYYKQKIGYQYIAEASHLKNIPNEKYDFLLASHCLEHCANPIKTLFEWKRVIKKNGIIVLVLPDKNHTFDHNRPLTSFQHLLDDYNNNTDETDLTHLNEILSLHDLKMDPPAGSLDLFTKRSKLNFENRCLHHHVFDIPLLEQVMDYTGFSIMNTYKKDIHQLILATKI